MDAYYKRRRRGWTYNEELSSSLYDVGEERGLLQFKTYWKIKIDKNKELRA